MEYLNNIKEYIYETFFEEELQPPVMFYYTPSCKPRSNKTFVLKSEIEKKNKEKKLEEEIKKLEERYINLIKDDNDDEDTNGCTPVKINPRINKIKTVLRN
jgi:hypothetical protein